MTARPSFLRSLLQWRPTVDLGWGVALLLAALSIWPLLTRPGLPTFMDGEQHVYRTYEIMAAWRAGVPYLRWAPDLFHAFGYPVFNYYSPLTYYLAAAYGWVFGGPVAGVKFVMGLAAALGAAGMYVFVRDQWGSLPGLVSAAAFSLAPYVMYIDPVARGDVPESLALAVAPWLWWAFTRLLRAPSVGGVTLGALTLATLILSHNLYALIFFGWLLLWLAWNFLGARLPPARPALRLGYLALAIGLGLGLTAFLWLPAGLERNAVQLSDATRGYLDFRRTFVSLPNLLRPAASADLDLRVTPVTFQLGLAQWVLAALGLGSLCLGRERRASGIFFALVGVVSIVFVLPESRLIWEGVSWLAFLQFPWRLLGPAALALGVLAGAAAHWAEQWPLQLGLPFGRRWRGGEIFGGLALAACVAAAMPLLDPLPWADFGAVSAVRVLKSGLDWWPGTTATNEFLPATVKEVPSPQFGLIQSYESGLVDKVQRAALPPNAQVTVAEHGPQHDYFYTASPAAFTLALFTFDFPGWTAYVNGVRTPITPAEPEGWITLTVPAGEHDVLVRFEDTWPRGVGWALSSLSLAAWLGVCGLAVRGGRSSASPVPRAASGRAALLLAVIGVGLIFRYTADQRSEWRLRPAVAEVRPATQTLRVELENHMALIGYDLPAAAVRPGESLALTLYWEAVAPVTRNVRVFVHVLDVEGKPWGLSDHLRPGGFDSLPTGRWPLFRSVRDAHTVALDPGTPAGAYTLRVGLWDGFTGERMRLLDAAGAVTVQDGIVLMDNLVVQP